MQITINLNTQARGYFSIVYFIVYFILKSRHAPCYVMLLAAPTHPVRIISVILYVMYVLVIKTFRVVVVTNTHIFASVGHK